MGDFGFDGMIVWRYYSNMIFIVGYGGCRYGNFVAAVEVVVERISR